MPEKHANVETHCKPAANLKVSKIGIVSRDYSHKYRNGFRDFSYVFSSVLRLLDEEGCDTVLFSSFSIIAPSFRFRHHELRLRHITSIFLEQFKHYKFVGGKWKKENAEAKHPYVVLYRSSSGWKKIQFQQKFWTLNPLTESKKAEIASFVRTEMPKRILGNCCLLLCGESNGVKYSRADKAVHDSFGVRRACKSVNVILNPIHDRMTRPEMPLKRAFLSKGGRWVISVWNKGRRDKNGKVKDGKHPAWTVYHNGLLEEIHPIPNRLGVEIGILDCAGGNRMQQTEVLGAVKREHIEEAMTHIDKHGVPKGRNSRLYSLRSSGRLYPPKYLIALGFKLATGEDLSPEDHSGGEADSNKKIRQLGFEDIVRQPSDRPEQ